MKKKNHIAASKGFSLIEMMVAITLFAVVMVVSIGALLALVTANRKARALESVMNNLNISLDSMVRSVRMGSVYNCGSEFIPSPEGTSADCGYAGAPESAPGTVFSFAPYGESTSDPGVRWVYSFEPDPETGLGRIYRIRKGSESIKTPITAPEVNIEEMKFYLVGSAAGDIVQPKLVVTVKGTAGEDDRTRTSFNIQATAVQRVLDI